ncbi:hypothetical protein IWW45_007101 [Coemansia sp. RSA 485]|nr:hypothetical protein IWW45_007101 [Coemansia sp. RSA 485]
MQTSIFVKRLMGELKRMKADSISNIRLVNHESLTSWTMAIKGAEGTLYAGEAFTLRLNFPDTYPYEAPEAVFIGEVPVHPHVYSNGHICLSILYQQWSPALTAESLCLSILSMLSSCAVKASII